MIGRFTMWWGVYENKDKGGEAKKGKDRRGELLSAQEIQREGISKVRSIIEVFRSLEERKLTEKSISPGDTEGRHKQSEKYYRSI